LDMDALAALRLQLEWGADEAIGEAPVNRFRATTVLPSTAMVQPTTKSIVARPTSPPSSPAIAGLAQRGAPAGVLRAHDLAAGAHDLDALRAALAGFDGCALSATATNLVFADGNPASGLMLVGESPGAEEDRAGKPFVGPSGQFLDRMLASIGLDRSRYLITNLIPWRPPGNRNPTDNEVLICLPFLLRHIALVRPRRLVLLGALASRAITGSNTGIRRLRGRWLDVEIAGLDSAVPALPMLHPAYLLRTPGAKRDAWTDLLLLRRTLDQDLSNSR
jgi:uracil-DNA glycosylase